MSKKRILYVEDDETLAFLTSDNLEQHFEVVHCNNGKEAFQLFCKETFDLCVLDIMLPDMDGFEIATEIRKRNQEIPIIFLSAKTMKEDRIKGLKLGADDYLAKPFSMEELLARITAILRRVEVKSTEEAAHLKVGKIDYEPELRLLHQANQSKSLQP